MSKEKFKLTIDFFEYSFLLEACIPPRPIARNMFWKDSINKHYFMLSNNQRSRLWEWMSRNSNFKDALNKNNKEASIIQYPVIRTPVGKILH